MNLKKKDGLLQKVWRVRESRAREREGGGLLRAVCHCDFHIGSFFFPC